MVSLGDKVHIVCPKVIVEDWILLNKISLQFCVSVSEFSDHGPHIPMTERIALFRVKYSSLKAPSVLKIHVLLSAPPKSHF